MFQCFIELEHKTFSFNSNDDDIRIKDLKQFIEDQEGLPIAKQQILYAGRFLNDDVKVKGKIVENATVKVWPK